MVNGPQGTAVDLNLLNRQLGVIRTAIQRNNMTQAKALFTTLLADVTSVNVLVQAADDSFDLPSDPTLADPYLT